MNIYIADCNHGFFEPEKEEASRLGVDLTTSEDVDKSLVDILIVQRLQVNAQVLDLFENCQVVTRYGVGLDNVDCEEVRARGISLINFPSFCTEEVANHAMGAILFCYRQFDVLLDAGDIASWWGNPNRINTIQSACNTTVGVLGAGRIGKAIISRLLSCGFRTIYYDPFLQNSEVLSIPLMKAERIMDFEKFLKLCSILTIHAPLTETTNKMINASTLSLLPDGACLVNTARGAIVSTEDLESSLSDNIRCAFIDVCDPEPPHEKTLNMAGLHVTPHCAFYSWGSLDRLKRGVIVESVREMQSRTSKCSK